MTDLLTERIRVALRRAADPTRAPQMQAYMSSAMPFLGVPVPEVRRLVRAAAGPSADLSQLLGGATELWRSAGYREERYAATELPGLRMARGRLEALPLCTEMIVTGAWWDHVDGVCPRIGALLLAHRSLDAAGDPGVVRSTRTGGCAGAASSASSAPRRAPT